MPAPPCGNYGDVTGDGTVNIGDVLMVQDHVTDPIAHPFTDEQKRRADVNGDGKVTVLDQTLIADYVAGAITTFPVCGVTPPPPTEITCNNPTPHYTSGCALLLHYGAIGGGVYEDVDHSIISRDERYTASQDQRGGLLTAEEYDFVVAAEAAGSINALCPGCYSVTPPTMETKTMALTEGQHTIQVSLSGYNTLQATINVSSTGVSCVSVVGGACGGTGLPRISTSGWTVTTYLKTGVVTTARCTWIATKDTSKVVFISEMVLAYNKLASIGFTPTAAEIGNAVLMYSNLGTPASLWGC